MQRTWNTLKSQSRPKQTDRVVRIRTVTVSSCHRIYLSQYLPDKCKSLTLSPVTCQSHCVTVPVQFSPNHLSWSLSLFVLVSQKFEPNCCRILVLIGQYILKYVSNKDCCKLCEFFSELFHWTLKTMFSNNVSYPDMNGAGFP